MRINRTDNILKIYGNNSEVKKIKSDKDKKGKDELKISDKAMDFQFAVSKLKEVPDMRMEKIEKIKKQIKTGTYQIDSNKIAEKIYNSANFDKTI